MNIKFYSYYYLALIAVTTVICGQDFAPNVDNSANNFLGPNLKTQYTLSTSANTAFAAAVEAGARNLRASGTFGWALDNNQINRIKLTGEYLWQDIDYSFYSSVYSKWVNQGAFGLAYQHSFDNYIFEHVDLATYYAHAAGFNLAPISGSFIDINGDVINYIDLRHIAGSNASGFSGGVTLQPWPKADVSLALNYDTVTFNTAYQPRIKESGIGGSVTLNQKLPYDLQANLQGALRQPFNNYTASFAWSKPSKKGVLSLGIYGGYLQGHRGLPSTNVAGLTVAYKISPDEQPLEIANNESFLIMSKQPAPNYANTLTDWVAEPAVHMPQVLAIAEEKVNADNTPFSSPVPQFNNTSSILDQQLAGSNNFEDLPTVSYFTPNTGLTFPLTVSPSPVPSCDTISIDPASGVPGTNITDAMSYTMTVHATNSCGTASSDAFTATLFPDTR